MYLLLSHLISDDVNIVHLLFHQDNSLTGAFSVNYRRQSHEFKEKPSLFQLMHVVLCKFFPIVVKRIKGFKIPFFSNLYSALNNSFDFRNNFSCHSSFQVHTRFFDV